MHLGGCRKMYRLKSNVCMNSFFQCVTVCAIGIYSGLRFLHGQYFVLGCLRACPMDRLPQDTTSMNVIPQNFHVVCSEMVRCSHCSCMILDTAPSHGPLDTEHF
jgi:hypothetical protein